MGMNKKRCCFSFKTIEGNLHSGNFVNNTLSPQNQLIQFPNVNSATTDDIVELRKQKELKHFLRTQALKQHELNSESNDHSTSFPDDNVACASFKYGTGMEFMSPNYPNNYPNNTTCVKLIDAGEEGMAVVVQFIDHFELESSETSLNCDYDYLQIRNGEFGYSPLAATICGTNPPSVITSTGRFLWLRFHSDDTINYKGFRAVYSFVQASQAKDDIGDCNFDIGGIEGEIWSESYINESLINNAKKFDKHLDCTWKIQAEVGKKIFLRFTLYELEVPNRCSEYAIEIYKSSEELRGIKGEPKKLCGSKAENLKSDDNVLALRLITKVNKDAKNSTSKTLSKFHANFTVVREILSDAALQEQCIPGEEFDCTDNYCISKKLVCNGKVNCQLRVDEDNCPDLKPEGLKADILFIAMLGCLLVAGMLGGLFLNVCRKLRQDKKEILKLREQVRKSRESGFQSERQSIGESLEPNQNQMTSLEEPSSQESGESKVTVIERSNWTPSAPQPSLSESQEKPNGDVLSKKLRVSVDVNPSISRSEVTYSPPLGYRSKPPFLPLKPNIVNPRRASGSDIVLSSSMKSPAYPQAVMLYEKPSTIKLVESSTDPLKSLESSTEQLQCIEVRDCACQTRDSYLSRLRTQQYLAPSAKLMRRAPLARGEALELQDMSQSMPVRRINRFMKAPGESPYYPYTYAASSASSETGRSLERLDELQDE